MNGKKLPVDNLTFLRVLNCTNNSRDYAALMCTFIHEWVEIHDVDKVTYAYQIADMIRRKVEAEGGQ